MTDTERIKALEDRVELYEHALMEIHWDEGGGTDHDRVVGFARQALRKAGRA